MTTTPLTSGGKSRRSRPIELPRTTSTRQAASAAPNTAPRPWSRPIAIEAPTKAMLVPMTTGIRPPTGPTGYDWTSVLIPAMTRTAWTSSAVVAASSSSARATSSGGVTLPSSIASRCWRPSGTATRHGGRSSTS